MYQSTGDIKVLFAYQLSNDGISWDTAVEITTDPTSLNADCTLVDTTFRDLANSLAPKLPPPGG